MTTDGRTDQPTENIQTVSIQALTMPKQIVFTGHANQGCAELSKNKFKCFLRSTGNLGRSHKSTETLALHMEERGGNRGQVDFQASRTNAVEASFKLHHSCLRFQLGLHRQSWCKLPELPSSDLA